MSRARNDGGYLRWLTDTVKSNKAAIAVVVAVPLVFWALRSRHSRRAARLSARSLRQKVEEAYASMTEAGEVIPLATADDDAVVETSTMPFVVSLRNAKGNAAKAAGSRAAGAPAKKKPRDAFAARRNPLHVTDFLGAHCIVLNKFPAVKLHVVIHTKDFVPQAGHLSAADLRATWHVVNELNGIGYFNSGPVSGASQPRRHTQVIPLDAIEEKHGGHDFPPLPVEALINSFRQSRDWKFERGRPFRLPAWDFAHAVSLNGGDLFRMPENEAADLLYDHYQALLRELTLHQTSDAAQSYNLLLTRTWMMVVPRARECWRGVGLNAMAYTGLMILPAEALPDFTAAPLAVLRTISAPVLSA